MESSSHPPGRFDAAHLLVALGAIVLLVSTFLDWFSPQINAWTAFELVDLILAAIAVVALAESVMALLGRSSLAAASSERALAALGTVAAVLVVAAIVNHPPAAIGRSLEIGIWLALVGAVLLAAGAAMTAGHVSLVVTRGSRQRGAAEPQSRPPAPGRPLRSPTEEPRSVHDEATHRVDEGDRPR